MYSALKGAYVMYYIFICQYDTSCMKSEENLFHFQRPYYLLSMAALQDHHLSRLFGCYLLSSSVDRSFLCLSFITFEPHPNPANTPKRNKTQTFMRHFFKSRASYPHAVPFPWETLRLPDSVPSLSFTFKVAADRPECKVDGGGLHSLWALINGDSEGFWGLAVTQG